MTSHKKMITHLWSFSFGFFTNHNNWSFLNNTSHFEIGAWNFWYFNIENKFLAFWASYISIQVMLSSKELGTNVLELHFEMLANHDQNILVLFRLAQSMYLCVKLELSYCRNLLCKFAWLDRSKIRLDQSKVVQIVFSAEFPTQPKPISRVRFYVLS